MNWKWHTWKMRLQFAAIAFLLALALHVPRILAATTCDQGAGNPNVTEWPTNISARVTGATSECLVTNGAGGTTCPATALAGRKAVELQNLGPNPIYCTVDGTAPVVSKARRIDALGSTAAPAWSLDVGPNVVIKCIAATAAQLTTAATIITELR